MYTAAVVCVLHGLQEEYLSAEEFKKVMGVDQDAYSKLPQWKKLQIKRQVNLF
jgi:hypothetical protein